MKHNNEIMLLAYLPRSLFPSWKQEGARGFSFRLWMCRGIFNNMSSLFRSFLGCSTSAFGGLRSFLPWRHAVMSMRQILSGDWERFWRRSKNQRRLNDSAVSWITSTMTRLQLSTFRLHSSRVGAAIDSFRRHLKCISAEFFPYMELDSSNHQDACEVHSGFIRDAVETFGQDSKWLAIYKYGN